MKRALRSPMESGSGGMPPKPAAKAKDGGPERVQKQLKVLIIDDISSIRRSVCRMVKSKGVAAEDISQAENGEEGLRKILAGDFDLIITDNNMPNMDGQNLVKLLAEEGRGEIVDKIVLQSAECAAIKTEVRALLRGRVLEKMEARAEIMDLTKHLMQGGAVKDWIPSTEEIY